MGKHLLHENANVKCRIPTNLQARTHTSTVRTLTYQAAANDHPERAAEAPRGTGLRHPVHGIPRPPGPRTSTVTSPGDAGSRSGAEAATIWAASGATGVIRRQQSGNRGVYDQQKTDRHRISTISVLSNSPGE
ncbi:hypothetical protein J6590_033790 [Homalodisca vitripennis]|nr:hypothetical protein J6590_033790 [Homalodisca vitripennis]